MTIGELNERVRKLLLKREPQVYSEDIGVAFREEFLKQYRALREQATEIAKGPK